MATVIKTPFGRRRVVRRVGVQGEFYETTPTSNAPHGEWWVLNPARGYVPIASNNRALVFALTGVKS